MWQAAFKESPDFFVAGFLADQAVPQQDALGVSVHDEDPVTAGIEQDRVGGFRPNAVDAQQPFAQLGRRRTKHPGQRTAKISSQEAYKRLQLLRLLAKVT